MASAPASKPGSGQKIQKPLWWEKQDFSWAKEYKKPPVKSRGGRHTAMSLPKSLFRFPNLNRIVV